MSDSMKDALLKGFEPQFVVTVEAVGDENKRGLPVLIQMVEGRIRKAYDCIPQPEDGKVVIFVRKGGKE